MENQEQLLNSLTAKMNVDQQEMNNGKPEGRKKLLDLTHVELLAEENAPFLARKDNQPPVFPMPDVSDQKLWSQETGQQLQAQDPVETEQAAITSADMEKPCSNENGERQAKAAMKPRDPTRRTGKIKKNMLKLAPIPTDYKPIYTKERIVMIRKPNLSGATEPAGVSDETTPSQAEGNLPGTTGGSIMVDSNMEDPLQSTCQPEDTEVKSDDEDSFMRVSSDANEPEPAHIPSQADENMSVMLIKVDKENVEVVTKEHKMWKCVMGKCKKSPNVFATEDDLQRHEEKHKPKRRYQCPHCDYCGNFLHHLDSHKIKEHKELEPDLDKQMLCTHDNCQKIFATEALLTHHYSVSHKAEFKAKTKVKGAKKMETALEAEGESDLKTQPKGKEDQIKCDLCDKTFTLKSSLKKHMDLHKETPSFECTYCKSTFKHRDTFRSHRASCKARPPAERKERKKRKNKAKTCDICGKQYAGHTSYKHHMLAHEGKFQYTCVVCSKQYNNELHYKEHLARHYGDKRFKCDECDHRTVSKADMKQHMRQHTDEKPFKCKYCDMEFTHISNCHTHQRNKHKEQLQANQQEREMSMKAELSSEQEEMEGVQVQKEMHVPQEMQVQQEMQAPQELQVSQELQMQHEMQAPQELQVSQEMQVQQEM